MRLIYAVKSGLIGLTGVLIRYQGSSRMVLSNGIHSVDVWSVSYMPMTFMFETVILHAMVSYIESCE